MEIRMHGGRMRRTVSMEKMLPLIEEILAADGTVTFNVTGMSMYPMLRHSRDTVTIIPVRKNLQKYDIPLYRRSDGTFVLHRIIGIDSDGYVCVGDHQVEPERGIRKEQVIGVVQSFCRGGIFVPVKTPLYQMYIRLWYGIYPFRRIYVKMRLAAGRMRKKHR